MTCDLCLEPGGKVLWHDAACRVVLVDEPGYAGFCRVVWKRHVREMTDLDERERQHLMRVVFAVEAALRETLTPHKINLASLGNVTPHLHWHVIPRFENDPHFPQPVWGERQREPRRGRADAIGEQLVASLAARLA
ncbi:MAG: HIT family protein [Burkholderiales bacterium]